MVEPCVDQFERHRRHLVELLDHGGGFA
jgi:hypothetical protein